jgi:exonuclease III
MKMLMWNIRGLNDILKQGEVRRYIRRIKVSLLCLVEIRVKRDKAEKI